MIEYVTNNWVEIGVAAGAIIMAAHRIALLTPTKSDDKIVNLIRKVAKTVGLLPDDNPGK